MLGLAPLNTKQIEQVAKFTCKTLRNSRIRLKCLLQGRGKWPDIVTRDRVATLSPVTELVTVFMAPDTSHHRGPESLILGRGTDQHKHSHIHRIERYRERHCPSCVSLSGLEATFLLCGKQICSKACF